MNRATEKLKDEIKDLRKEMVLLRSVIIGFLGEDREGRYRPEFVKEILRAAKDEPEFTFNGANELLKQLKNI